jgi:hypothetical protein
MHMAHIVREMRGVAPTANDFFLLETCFFCIYFSRANSYTTSEVAIPEHQKPHHRACWLLGAAQLAQRRKGGA